METEHKEFIDLSYIICNELKEKGPLDPKVKKDFDRFIYLSRKLRNAKDT